MFLLLSLVPVLAQQQQSDYVVGPQDVLSITVWDQADASGKFTVETDGSFTFPMIGRVKAGGLTLKQIEAELKKKLADGWFKNPQVTVAVDTYRSQRVYVSGEVRTPGTYVLTGDMSLIEALTRAGSTTPNASYEVVITHAAEGKPTAGAARPADDGGAMTTRVDLNALQSGTLSQNVVLKDGDTIYVPRAETVFVSGQVRNPGEYVLHAKDTTVLQAISLAGGATDRGSTSRVRVVRVVDGAKKEIKVKLTDLVRGGDTVVVQERFF